MNEHLQERFGRFPDDRHEEMNHDLFREQNQHQHIQRTSFIQKYYNDFKQLSALEGWVSLPEIPTAAELARPVDEPWRRGDPPPSAGDATDEDRLDAVGVNMAYMSSSSKGMNGTIPSIHINTDTVS